MPIRFFFFPVENHALYEIMTINTVEPDGQKRFDLRAW